MKPRSMLTTQSNLEENKFAIQSGIRLKTKASPDESNLKSNQYREMRNVAKSKQLPGT